MRPSGSAYSLVLAFVLFGCSRDCSLSAGKTKHQPPLLLAGAGKERPEEGKLRPVAPAETTPAIEQRAREILETHPDAPLEAEFPFQIEGHDYLARIEEHYHEPGGQLRPWGRHRGVTVYHAR